MLRTILIIVWLAALAFFVWEFIVAGGLPERYRHLKPLTIRLVDVAFAAAILLTLYYLITDPS